jgi:Rrf2 family protein
MRKETAMLNQTTEHALRALLYLAQRPRGEAVAADRMASALGAPANYLGKTLRTLARRGILGSTRGAQGGFRLLRPAGEITVAEVWALFADPRPRTVCLLGDRPCCDEAPCSAHGTWQAMHAAAEAPLRHTTLADLLRTPFAKDPAGGKAGSSTILVAPAA